MATLSPAICKLGAWLSTSDSFVAHPSNPNGAILDLNDGVNFTLLDPNGKGNGLDWGSPQPVKYKGSNARVPGQRIPRQIYNENRTLTLHLWWGTPTMATYTNWIANLRALVQTCEGINIARPGALQIQVTNASAPVYADVKSATTNVPYDELLWMQLVEDGITVTMEIDPFFRGQRQNLQNMVVNPGFEGPSGGAVTVFSDTFANANAYAVIAGSSPTVASHVLTIPSGTTLQFGSPAWQDYNLYKLRFQWTTGTTFTVTWHYCDSNDYYQIVFNGSTLQVNITVAGTTNNRTTYTASLTNNNWYWLQLTQLGFLPGRPTNASIQINFNNDSSGGVGSSIVATTVFSVNGYNATLFQGPIRLASSGGSTAIGGNFGNVHVVGLFGPGGWLFTGAANSATGLASGSWDAVTTYAGGPTTSYWAGRIDAPPAGTFSANWLTYGGGNPLNTWAIPITTGQTLALAAWTKSTGLGANSQIQLGSNEYDSSGNFLRNNTLTLTGNQASWTKLSLTFTAGASTAYASFYVQAQDLSGAGNSANATVWFDNCQAWNQTLYGSTMPYGEFWFAQTPCTMVASGLLGDVQAPCAILAATQINAGTMTVYLGRRFNQTSFPTMPLAGASYVLAGNNPTLTLSSSDYNGYHLSGTAAAMTQCYGLYGINAGDWMGTFHLLARIETTGGASPTAQSWSIATTLNVTAYTTTLTDPFAANSTWTLADLGQVVLPPNGPTTLADLSQATMAVDGLGNTGTQASAVVISNSLFLLPVDADLVIASIVSSDNYPAILMDGRNGTIAYAGGSTTSFTMSTAFVGGQATSLLGSQISVTSTGSRRVVVDPALPGRNGVGVNQWGVLISDASAAVYPLLAQLVYTPLYLYPQ